MNKHQQIRIITVLFLLTQTFPPFNLIMPFIGIIQVAIFTGLFVMMFPRLIEQKTIIALLAYGSLNCYFYLRGNQFYSGFNSVIVPFLHMISGLLITEYALKYDKNNKYTRLVVITVITANVIMAMISIPMVNMYPNMMRGAELNNATAPRMVSIFAWIMSYSTVHGIPLLMPPLTFLLLKSYNYRKEHKRWFFVFLVLLYITYLSNATTAFLLSVIAVFTTYFFNMERFERKKLKKMVVVGIIASVIFQPTFLLSGLEVAKNTMDERASNYKKIEEFEDELEYGESEGDFRNRVDLYETSSELFAESPFFGTSTPELISKHTWIVDRLALFGLVFFIPVVYLFYVYFRRIYSVLIHTKVIFVYGFSTMLFMLLLKNDFGQGTWHYGFAYLPLFCRYIDYQIDNNFKTKR